MKHPVIFTIELYLITGAGQWAWITVREWKLKRIALPASVQIAGLIVCLIAWPINATWFMWPYLCGWVQGVIGEIKK